jgi:hypothetical protein
MFRFFVEYGNLTIKRNMATGCAAAAGATPAPNYTHFSVPQMRRSGWQRCQSMQQRSAVA